MNIFLFHRDFRVEDNIGLNKLIKEGKDIYLFFIFNKQQSKDNEFFNSKAFNYMIKALKNLNKKIKVNFFESINEINVFKEILKKKSIKRIYTNLDFTNFALKRDRKLKSFCISNNIEYKRYNDYLLFNPGDITKKDGTEYKIFKYFYLKCMEKEKQIKKPETLKFNDLEYTNNLSININDMNDEKIDIPIERQKVVQLIQNLDMDDYKKRDYWNIKTNNISAAIKFGIVSCREVVNYFICKKDGKENLDNKFLRQFIWREFYYHLFVLSVKNNKYVFGKNYLKKMDSYEWENDLNKLSKWEKGETGFPLIDASMIYLNKTGQMHNRLRMIVASFLIKNLNIHWKYGEKYFAKTLIDYDPIVNQASWQWVAGTGFEANPFFRIFNIETQEKKFDPNREFVKSIIDLNTYKITPIVNLKESRAEALKKYKKIITTKIKL